MGRIQSALSTLMGKPDVPFVEDTPKDESVSVKDMLRFMEKQSEANTQLMSAIAQASLAQAETMKTYIDLFKPTYVKSTTLDERENRREESTKIRESEWAGIDSAAMFKELTGGTSDGIPPELSEW